MAPKLPGQCALVVGASGGLGGAIAQALATEGTHVMGASCKTPAGSACAAWMPLDLADLACISNGSEGPIQLIKGTTGCRLPLVQPSCRCIGGPLLARRAAEAGVLHSFAYGDQPALIAELVDWARTARLEVVCAGKGTKYLPRYHSSTPDTVWDHYGFTPEQVAGGGFNPQMSHCLA